MEKLGKLTERFHRLTGVAQAQTRVLEALDSLEIDGILEATGAQILERVRQLDPGSGRMGTIMLSGALKRLVSSGQVVHWESEKPNSTSDIYHRVDPPLAPYNHSNH